MKFVASLFFAAALTFLPPAEVYAQEEGRFALGASFNSKPTLRNDSHATGGLGLLWRFGRGHEGWGWKYGFNFYSTELDRTLSEGRQSFGELNIKPILGGYGYTHVLNSRTKVSGNLLAGYAFTTFSLREPFARAYIIEHHIDTVDVESSSSFVMKPEVSTWFDVARKVGINVSVGYMFARPNITVTSPIGREHGRVNADVFLVKAGVVYSIF